MTEIKVLLDGVYGDVKITITRQEDQQHLKFRWYQAEDGTTGFTSNVLQTPIVATPVAAEMILKIIVASIMRVLNIAHDKLSVFNHLGDKIQEIEFMPPTFNGKEADIQRFVAQQDSLKNLYSAYETTQRLDENLILACEEEGVLEDFLSLVQFQMTKAVFTFSQPQE